MTSGSWLPTKKLIEFATRGPRRTQPIETHQSFPIPVVDSKGIRVAFLYSSSHVSPEAGLELRTPEYIAFLLPDSGKLDEMRALAPGEYGQSHAAGEILGKYILPRDLNREEFIARQQQLYEAYDALLPLFAAGKTDLSALERKEMVDFQALFAQLAEPPLAPYYGAIAKDFFAWLKKFGR